MLWRIAISLPATRLLSTVTATRRLVFGLIGSLPAYVAVYKLVPVRHASLDLWLLFRSWSSPVDGIGAPSFSEYIRHSPFFALLATIMYCYGVIGVRVADLILFFVCVYVFVYSTTPLSLWLRGRLHVSAQVLWFGGLMDESGVNFNSATSAMGALLQILTGESWHQVMYRAVDAVDNIAATIYFISLVALVLLLFANVFIGIVVDSFQELDDLDETSETSRRTRGHIRRYEELYESVQARRILRFMVEIKGKLRRMRRRRQSRK